MRPPTTPGAVPFRSVFRPWLRSQPRLRRYQSSSSPEPDRSSSPEKPNDGEKVDAIPVPNTVAPLPLWQRLGPLTTVASAYARAQKRRPWGTQFVSALIIYGIADISAQSIGSDDDLDPKRIVHSLVIGGIAAIPSYSWFIWLSHNFNYSSRLLSLATKIVVSQLVFTPTFNTYFFGAQAFFSGCSPAGVIDRIVNTVPTSIANSCRFWPIVTAFSFTYIPIEYRSVFSGVIAIGWQTYLALLNRKAEMKTRMEEAGAVEAVAGKGEKA